MMGINAWQNKDGRSGPMQCSIVMDLGIQVLLFWLKEHIYRRK